MATKHLIFIIWKLCAPFVKDLILFTWKLLFSDNIDRKNSEPANNREIMKAAPTLKPISVANGIAKSPREIDKSSRYLKPTQGQTHRVSPVPRKLNPTSRQHNKSRASSPRRSPLVSRAPSPQDTSTGFNRSVKSFSSERLYNRPSKPLRRNKSFEKSRWTAMSLFQLLSSVVRNTV